MRTYMQNRIKWIALTILIIFSAILGYAGLKDGHNWGGDFSGYIMQAKSIAEGNPHKYIEENRLTVEQSSIWWSTAYPWGMPVLLAPIYMLYGMNMLAFKSLNVVRSEERRVGKECRSRWSPYH